MAANKQFPRTITAGDTFKQAIVSSYKASDGFTVELHLTGPSGNPSTSNYSTTELTDTTFELHIAPAVTATLAEGLYNLAIVATDGTDEFTIESGTVDVVLRADLQEATDLRSSARRMLDALDAALLGTATSNQLSMSIAGRSISRIPLTELKMLRDYYVKEVAKENKTSKKVWKIRLNNN